jgi:hypothetical protein
MRPFLCSFNKPFVAHGYVIWLLLCVHAGGGDAAALLLRVAITHVKPPCGTYDIEETNFRNALLLSESIV